MDPIDPVKESVGFSDSVIDGVDVVDVVDVVWAIDVASGKILWKLGGTGSTRSTSACSARRPRILDSLGGMSHRIASLLPSATEIVCALGARDELVGVSHECDFPASVVGLPVLTRARLTPVRTSFAIDTEVRALVESALAVYEIEIDRLREADPDVIVTQDLCEVCAVSLDDVTAAIARLGMRGVAIVNVHPKLLADVASDVQRVADALGRPEDGARVVHDMRHRIDQVRTRSAHLPKKPTVLSIEWLDPVMIGGMWMPELIALAGGTPLVTHAGDHAPTLDLAALRALDPDVLLIKPCGFPLAQTLEELSLVKKTLPWDSWQCVKEGRVYVADGNAYFNRSGPRLVESIEIVAGAVHPRVFPDLRSKHAASVVRIDRDLSIHDFAL